MYRRPNYCGTCKLSNTLIKSCNLRINIYTICWLHQCHYHQGCVSIFFANMHLVRSIRFAGVSFSSCSLCKRKTRTGGCIKALVSKSKAPVKTQSQYFLESKGKENVHKCRPFNSAAVAEMTWISMAGFCSLSVCSFLAPKVGQCPLPTCY